MPGQMRIDFPGAIHHVMSCGDRRENIYLDEVDRQDFLKTLAEASAISPARAARMAAGAPAGRNTAKW